MKLEKSDTTTPEQRARQLLEHGTSIRETVRLSGLTQGQVVRLRAELEGERRAMGLEPLGRGRPGPARVDLGVSAPSRLVAQLDQRAELEGLSRQEYVIRALWPEDHAKE